MLYRADVAASDAFMKQAEAMQPDEPFVWLERAMQEHRAHNCRTAVGYHDRFHATDAGRDHRTSWARAVP